MIHSQAVAQTPLMYEQEWAGLLARIAAGDPVSYTHLTLPTIYSV